MRILAIEFSSPQRSVAVVQERKGVPVLLGSCCAALGPADHRSADALGLIDRALSLAQIQLEQIECVAVGVGPGSYTGIRAAIALAQGWQLARAVKLLAVSSADCLAAQAQAEGLSGLVLVVIDAQRNDVYLAGYALDPDGWRQVEPLRLASQVHVQQRLLPGQTIVGPEATRWFPTSRAVFPSAAALGRLAVGRADFITGEKLEPIYLRQTAFVKAPPSKAVL